MIAFTVTKTFVAKRLELEVPEAGYEGTCCDQGYGGYEEGWGHRLLQDDHAEDEVDEGGAALDGAVHGDVHAVQGDQGEGRVGGK